MSGYSVVISQLDYDNSWLDKETKVKNKDEIIAHLIGFIHMIRDDLTVEVTRR